MKTKKLVLFDFDGTLTTKDTMIEFIRFIRGSQRVLLGFVALLPTMAGYKAGLIPNDRAKSKLLKHHFGGLEKTFLDQKSQEFADQIIPGLLRTKGIEALKKYQEEGNDVYIVSASLDIWLEKWTQKENISLICTLADWDQGAFSGGLKSANCHGPEKVNRIKELVDLGDYKEVIAYGDSGGDKEMLELADESFYQPFRD